MRRHLDDSSIGTTHMTKTMHATTNTSLYTKNLPRHKRYYGALLALVMMLSLEVPLMARCAKEFDWSEFGMSLSNSKSSSPQSNLRILVSPQRRMTKGYDYEYVNSNQTSASGGQADSSSYAVVPSSGGSTYLSSASAHPSQTAAYSALSASLASLKSRLSSRGVSSSNSMSDNGSSSLYSPSSGPSYGFSSLSNDPLQGQQSSPEQSATTFLSMSASQQDPQVASPGQYTIPPTSHGNDNKTIVLAIPAKINFLTEGRSSKPQSYQQQPSQPQQAQQMTVIQSPNTDQRPDPYATSKQQIETADQSRGQIAVGEPSQEHTGGGHQQYVIVNQSPSTYQSNDPHSHLVAANLSPSSNQPAQMGQMYSSATYAAAATGYQQQQQQHQQQQQAAQPSAMMSSYALKYLPTYQTTQTAASAISQPTIQKLYNQLLEQSTGGSPASAATGASYEATAQQNGVVAVDSSAAPYDSASMINRYMSCLDTCNSADPRWRKYTISKYKACCSRSSLYDATYDQPSADRVGDTGAKYSEDAYYNYLYRRSRTRRSRRQRQNRYNKQQMLAGLSDEDGSSLEDLPPKYGGSLGRGQAYSNGESPYMKYYKSRPSGDLSDGPSGNGGESGGKYGKERSYKQRGRGQRDIDSSVDSPASGSGGDMYDEDAPGYAPSGRGSSSGGSSYNGDYSSTDSGRYSQELGRQPAPAGEEEEVRPVYDDAVDSDKSYSLDSADYPTDSAPGDPGQSVDEHEQPEVVNKSVPAPKRQRKLYNGGGGSSGSGKSRAMRERKLAGEKESKSYSRKGRKSTYGAKNSKSESNYSNNQTNVSNNEYESGPGSPIDQQPPQQQRQNQESSGNEDEPQQAYGGAQRDASSSDGAGTSNDNEKNAMATKYRQLSINDTAVANLSKTTMHLKEILSLLEKKALLRNNETSAPSSSSSYQTASATSTPSPTTTTASSSIYSHSYLGGVPLSLQSSNDYFTTAELGLKSPYRLEIPSLSASSLSSSSLPSTFAASLNSDSAFGSPFGSQGGHNTFGLLPSASSSSSKQLAMHNVPQTRKRRVPKTPRYGPHTTQVYQKAHAGFGHPSSAMMMSASSPIKNPILSPAYYSTLHYTPYVFGRGGISSLASASTSYPYKSLHKTHLYSSALHHGPSKLAQSATLYTDGEGSSKLHGMSNYDPLANVASVLRPSTAMRLRNKPFIFHSPHHFYARQPFLSQSVEVKKAKNITTAPLVASDGPQLGILSKFRSWAGGKALFGLGSPSPSNRIAPGQDKVVMDIEEPVNTTSKHERPAPNDERANTQLDDDSSRVPHVRTEREVFYDALQGDDEDSEDENEELTNEPKTSNRKRSDSINNPSDERSGEVVKSPVRRKKSKGRQSKKSEVDTLAESVKLLVTAQQQMMQNQLHPMVQLQNQAQLLSAPQLAQLPGQLQAAFAPAASLVSSPPASPPALSPSPAHLRPSEPSSVSSLPAPPPPIKVPAALPAPPGPQFRGPPAPPPPPPPSPGGSSATPPPPPPPPGPKSPPPPPSSPPRPPQQGPSPPSSPRSPFTPKKRLKAASFDDVLAELKERQAKGNMFAKKEEQAESKAERQSSTCGTIVDKEWLAEIIHKEISEETERMKTEIIDSLKSEIRQHNN